MDTSMLKYDTTTSLRESFCADEGSEYYVCKAPRVLKHGQQDPSCVLDALELI